MKPALFIAFKGRHFDVSEGFHEELVRAFPRIDLFEQYLLADVWITANPRRVKKNYARFIVNWLKGVPKQASEARLGLGPSDMGIPIKLKTPRLRQDI